MLCSTRNSWNCKEIEIEICFSICNICVTWKIFKISKKIYTSRKRRKTNVSWFWIGKQVVLKDLVYDVSALSTEKYEDIQKWYGTVLINKYLQTLCIHLSKSLCRNQFLSERENFKVKTSKKIQSCVLAYASTHKWFTCFDENEQHQFLNNRNNMEANCDIKQNYESKWQIYFYQHSLNQVHKYFDRKYSYS